MARTSLPLDSALQEYILRNSPPEHAELARLRGLAQDMPRGGMQIAPEQGHFLAFLVKLIQVRRILEIGTFTGYSSLAMALALPPNQRFDSMAPLVHAQVREAFLIQRIGEFTVTYPTSTSPTTTFYGLIGMQLSDIEFALHVDNTQPLAIGVESRGHYVPP